MAFGSIPHHGRPFSSGQIPMRQVAWAVDPREYGWAAWTYSKQAKLNAWAWHGLGATSTSNVNAWTSLGSSVYLRREGDDTLYVMRQDTYVQPSEVNAESLSVYAETQWLDFGKPAERKALYGIDFDGVNVVTVEVYVSENGGRTGVLSETVPIMSADGGWTYNGDLVPLESAGTEFKLRFIGHPDLEVQVNRMTLHWDSMEA